MRTLDLPRKATTRFDLPAVCVVTGETEGVEHRPITFTFIPVWARLSVAFCGLLGVIVMLASAKRAEVELPFTPAGYAHWKQAQRITAGLLIVGVGALVAFLLADEPMLGLVIFVPVLIAAVVHGLTVTRGAGPQCKEITDDRVTLVLPSEEAADAIEARLGLGDHALAAAEVGIDEPERERGKYERQLDEELAGLH